MGWPYDMGMRQSCLPLDVVRWPLDVQTLLMRWPLGALVRQHYLPLDMETLVGWSSDPEVTSQRCYKRTSNIIYASDAHLLQLRR